MATKKETTKKPAAKKAAAPKKATTAKKSTAKKVEKIVDQTGTTHGWNPSRGPSAGVMTMRCGRSDS